MAGRAFCVKIHLDIQAVTCPGVWLCPNGKVALRINTLNTCAETHRICPIFPLLFHEKFSFSKVFARIVSLAELQRTLEQEFLYAELIQWITPTSRRIVLATFETNLADLLYPAPCFKGLLAGVDIDLLMEPSKCFPGIIAPKIEVSTKTIVEEVLDSFDTSMRKCHYVINPKMINSKQTPEQRKKPVKGILRQRRVCHTKPRSQSCRPYRQRSSSVDEPRQCPSCTTNQQAEINQCYHLARKNPCRLYLQRPAVCDNTHVMDNCPVCSKYNCYFSKCYDDSDVRYIVPKQIYRNTVRNHGDTLDNREFFCVCEPSNAFDTQDELAMSSKLRHLQRTKKRLCAAETGANDFADCESTRDYSSQGFYKNLEKFYKRMYKHAKIRAKEVED